MRHYAAILFVNSTDFQGVSLSQLVSNSADQTLPTREGLKHRLIENPRVGGSIPPLGTIKTKTYKIVENLRLAIGS